jgi:hypothetical protein
VLNIRQRSHHVIFTLVTVFSFWFFFSFAGRPILNTLPNGIITAFNSIVIVVGSIWGYRTFKRTPAHYYHERDSITVSSSDLDSTAVDLEEIPSELLNQRVELKSDLANSTSTVVKRSTKNKSTTTQTRRNS